MNDPERRGPAARLAAALALLSALGCRGGVKPEADLARSSLAAALDAWRSGGRPGAIPGTTPPVHAVDAVWQSGRKLESYEIIEESDGEGDRRFGVRLKQAGPAAGETARYVVLGRGPVWVYREEDYQRMVNMDNNPGPARAAPSRRNTRQR